MVIKISNAKWASAEKARYEVERVVMEWGRTEVWDDMIFRCNRSSNLQTLTTDAVLSVQVGEVLKGLLRGT